MLALVTCRGGCSVSVSHDDRRDRLPLPRNKKGDSDG